MGPGEQIRGAEFRLFQELIQREAGIHLAPVKRALLVARLSPRLRALGLGSYREYYQRVVMDEAERVRMVECVCTHETAFFREPAHYDFLGRLCERWQEQAAAGGRQKRVRVWSAACSTGEEPYSLAMVLLSRLPPEWGVEVLATDLSTRALERAQAGVWPVERARQIPAEYLKAYMLKGVRSQEGWMRAGPELRRVVRFEQLNLHAVHWPALGMFDAIFCRNVMIYFTREVKEAVVRRLLGHLGPGGHFFVGHSESLAGVEVGARCVAPAVYTRQTV